MSLFDGLAVCLRSSLRLPRWGTLDGSKSSGLLDSDCSFDRSKSSDLLESAEVMAARGKQR